MTVFRDFLLRFRRRRSAQCSCGRPEDSNKTNRQNERIHDAQETLRPLARSIEIFSVRVLDSKRFRVQRCGRGHRSLVLSPRSLGHRSLVLSPRSLVLSPRLCSPPPFLLLLRLHAIFTDDAEQQSNPARYNSTFFTDVIE